MKSSWQCLVDRSAAYKMGMARADVQMACSDQQSDMYPLVLGAVLEACRNNRGSGSQAREDLQKEKERREAAAASNAKLQDMVERVMQDAQSAYIKCAARPATCQRHAPL
jgi:hypothetical protein